MIKVGIIVGSSRENSNTARFGLALKRVLEDKGITEIHTPNATQYDIPFLNKGSLSMSNLSSYQKSVFQAVSESDIVFFLSPEYNWTVSAEILNMFNQFGSKEFHQMWENKVFAFAGISAGRGGRMPALDMSRVVSKLVSFFGFSSVISPKVFESQLTPQALGPNGESLGNEMFDSGLAQFVEHHLP